MSYDFVPTKKALIDRGFKGKPYVVWVDSKEPHKQHFRVYLQRKDLYFEVRHQRDMYYNAVIFKDLPIRPFLDIDIDVKDGDIDEKMAEDIYNRILNATRFTLESLEVPDEYCCEYENSDCMSVATDHRPGKFSYAVYYENIYFKNKSCLESFYTMVKEQLEENGDGNCIQYFDTPNSNFRLVGCAKTTGDHKRQWVNEKDREDSTKIDLCFPNIIPHGAHLIDIHETISDNHNTVEITDELEKQVLALCKKDKYLTENFTYTPIHNHDNFQFTRVSSAPCDLCRGKVHDSQNAYVIIKGTTVYRKCYQDSSKSIRMGMLETVIPDDILNTFIEDEPKPETTKKNKPVEILPPPSDEKKQKLKYYSDAAYLIGANWSSDDVNNFIKACCFKVVLNDETKWITLDYDTQNNIEVMRVQAEPPFWDKSNRRTVQIDSKDYDLSKYIIDFCNKPNNFYKNMDNFPYLHESENKYANTDCLNLWRGFNFPYTKLRHNEVKSTIKHWIDHFYYICNNDDTFIKWLAHSIQRPYEKAFNIQMLGKKGTGKSIIFQAIERIFGNRITLQVANLDEITGNFNAALESKLLINLNECTNFTTKKEQNIFKSLTTETSLRINQKFQPSYRTNFYGRFFITTNEQFGISITPDDRRNYCVETPSSHKNNEAYFAKMVADLNSDNNTPFIDLFNYLANLDISDFKPMKPPMTNLKRKLIKTSINPIYHYLYEIAEAERGDDILIKREEKEDEFIVQHKLLYDDYKKYMVQEGEPAQLVKRKKQFDTILLELGLEYKRYQIHDIRIRGYKIILSNLKGKLNNYINDEL